MSVPKLNFATFATIRVATREDKLSEDILTHKKAYYAGHAFVSDEFYDALEDRLRQLNPNHPTLSVVGAGEEHD